MKKFLSLAVALALLTSCGGRMPSAQRSQHLIEKHFKKYGRKYKDSDFGKYPVQKVEISSINELQHHLAEVEAFTILSGEGGAYKIRATLEKKTLGWKLLSWESLASR
jgi:hypothetical protein